MHTATVETKKGSGLFIQSLLKKMVGAVGFEPTTSCSQGRRANQAALRPDKHHEIFFFYSASCDTGFFK